MTPAKPHSILAAWESLTSVDRRELLEDGKQQAAADVFAKHADQYLDPKTGTFTFPMFADMALVMSTAAVQKALKHSPQTAEELANLVTLTVGSRRHQRAATVMIQLVSHLSPKVK